MIAVDPHIFFSDTQYLEIPYDHYSTEYPGDRLGSNSRNRGSKYSHLENYYEKDIQADIQDRTENKKDKRRPGIPDGAKDRRQHVIQHDKRNAKK